MVGCVPTGTRDPIPTARFNQETQFYESTFRCYVGCNQKMRVATGRIEQIVHGPLSLESEVGLRGRWSVVARLKAMKVIREAKSGRTKPLIISCHSSKGQPIEVFCKLSEGCDEGVLGLAMEVVAACIAIHLKLPVPDPFLVDLPPRLASLTQDERIGSRIRASSSVAFGSKFLPGRFSSWQKGSKVSGEMIQIALEAFVFDAVVGNLDRRPGNPNCLDSGREISLIDHELAFPRNLIGNQTPPWELGGLQWLRGDDRHIFWSQLRRHARRLDFDRAAEIWTNLSDGHLDQVRNSVPSEWDTARQAVDVALDQVREARANMKGVLSEVRRVLK